MATHACKAGGWKCGRYRDKARWTGSLTQHCTVCGELFVGWKAADMHATLDDDGYRICHDPASLTKRNGRPMFEKVPEPTWDPPYVWRRAETNPHEHPEAVRRRNLRTPAAVPAIPGTPSARTVSKIDARRFEEAS